MHINQYSLTAVAAATAVSAAASSLKDIKHIVLFMQENRAFDHYYGTMAGVRNFADPNVAVDKTTGLTTLQQPITPAQNGATWMTPYYINYLGGDYINGTQCMEAGSNSYQAMHGAYADGNYNNWTVADTPYSLSYFTRKDLPTHFDIADGFTLLDMNHQPVMTATDPNRCIWLSGSINVPGSPSNLYGDGGAMLDNTASPGCDIEYPIVANCFPFTWKTFPEYLEEAGVSWQLWQDVDNFEDNPLAYFQQYQMAANGSALKEKGDSYIHNNLKAFYKAAAEGTLPSVSWIVGPQELSEHPPNRPVDGAWLQREVVEAVMNGKNWEQTALIISYDEQGGFFDHVPPVVAPEGTPGEWLQDPYLEFGYVPVGPGPRVPRTIISPWTRGGNVFVETSDHNSELMFVEQWAAAQGYKGVYSKEITQWRRETMSNLVNAFDFENPDFSKPYITPVATPETYSGNRSSYWSGEVGLLGSNSGPYVQPSLCLAEYPNNQAPVPYGPTNAHQNLSLLVEEGFKPVRGLLTEGRFLTFEAFGLALTNVDGKMVDISPATAAHEDIRQRWILHATGSPNTFYIQSAVDKTYVSTKLGYLTPDVQDAQALTISYTADGSTYSVSIDEKHKSFITIPSARAGGKASRVAWGSAEIGRFKVFSVSYHS